MKYITTEVIVNQTNQKEFAEQVNILTSVDVLSDQDVRDAAAVLNNILKSDSLKNYVSIKYILLQYNDIEEFIHFFRLLRM